VRSGGVTGLVRDGALARSSAPSARGAVQALTPDRRFLLVAATSETVVLNVARLESAAGLPFCR